MRNLNTHKAAVHAPRSTNRAIVSLCLRATDRAKHNYSIFSMRSNQMKRTRFKRVAKPSKTTETSEYNDDQKAQTVLATKSSSIRARTKSRVKPQTQTQFGMHLDSISVTHHFSFEKSSILPPDFCQIDALDLAPLLLGKYLRRDDVVLQITEVEAYRPNDSACHGRFGITARTAPVFGPGGHAYVYLCYGLHTMLNIVADREGVGAAVLIRSCAPVKGLEIIQQRRGQITEKPVLLSGPGKVGQALGISTEWSNHPLFTPAGWESSRWFRTLRWAKAREDTNWSSCGHRVCFA
ncbi:DNA-3-methyladenine glycosylase isoform X2 [Diospyros lotus]|uniref:DNA-3-methyladenine glycosylase isoform X2 n=1 Tax=Diospyros lotus TaxID=55363 RepID=UPI00225859D1|nr:DNA-3-methyladenine glycosylase isoform X2 [Diospyros lotus]